MGLDQMAYSQEPPTRCEIGVWRKHPNLQGWMERLWLSQGNEGTFNCRPLRLEIEDIEQLQEDVEDGNLAEGGEDTDGFFFGDNSDEYYKEEDLAFCRWALTELEEGKEVYYDSWW